MDKLRVLIVDDSRIFRGVIAEALAGCDDIEVAGSVRNGVLAMEFIRTQQPPDLVTLDVEMPDMDGLATLQAIQEFNCSRPGARPVGAIMVSAFTRQGADITIRALASGAFDFITKPAGGAIEDNVRVLHRELTSKIRQFGRQRLAGNLAAPPTPASQSVPSPSPASPFCRTRVKAIVIGVSTGGPRALTDLLPPLSEQTDVPMLIVQHMPPTFTRSLAENLDRRCRHRVIEAAGEEVLERGHIYIAPGGRHLLIRRDNHSQVKTALNDQPPEHGCRPSVDVLFRSAAAVYGGDVIAVVLTGMGSDGTRGLAPLKRAGAHVIVQDEATSVVWGMPGSAAAAGYPDQVLPLLEMPAAIAAVLKNRQA